MQDKETGTLWSHITGEALDGPHKGEFLETLPSVQTTWAEWYGEHPDTRVLKKEQEVLGSRYENYFRDPERAGMFRVEWLRDRLRAKAIVYGVSRGPFSVAVTGERLETDPIIHTRVGEDSLVIQRNEDGGVRAFVVATDDSGAQAPPVEVKVLPIFWFAWSNFHPRTDIIE